MSDLMEPIDIGSKIKTTLYRHFSSDGTLLYVGVSLSALTRLYQHKLHSNWFEEISTVTMVTYETREDALAAETFAIQNESPKFNVYKKSDVREKRETRHEKSKRSMDDLVHRTVNFNILYRDEDVAGMLFLNRRQVKDLIESGKLGGIKTYESTRKVKNGGEAIIRKYAISGWQLIDFVETCEKTGEFPFARKEQKV